MSIKFHKKTAVGPIKQSDFVEEINELGKLHDTIAELEHKLSKSVTGKVLAELMQKASKKEAALRELMEADLYPEDILNASGAAYAAKLGAQANKTEITAKSKIVDYLRSCSDDEFLSMVKFSITELRQYLPGPFFKQVTKTARTGNRSWSFKKL